MIYVTPLRPGTAYATCNMYSDAPHELEAIRRQMGIPDKKLFLHPAPHYKLSRDQRKRALLLYGAQTATVREWAHYAGSYELTRKRLKKNLKAQIHVLTELPSE